MGKLPSWHKPLAQMADPEKPRAVAASPRVNLGTAPSRGSMSVRAPLAGGISWYSSPQRRIARACIRSQYRRSATAGGRLIAVSPSDGLRQGPGSTRV